LAFTDEPIAYFYRPKFFVHCPLLVLKSVRFAFWLQGIIPDSRRTSIYAGCRQSRSLCISIYREINAGTASATQSSIGRVDAGYAPIQNTLFILDAAFP